MAYAKRRRRPRQTTLESAPVGGTYERAPAQTPQQAALSAGTEEAQRGREFEAARLKWATGQRARESAESHRRALEMAEQQGRTALGTAFVQKHGRIPTQLMPGGGGAAAGASAAPPVDREALMLVQRLAREKETAERQRINQEGQGTYSFTLPGGQQLGGIGGQPMSTEDAMRYRTALAPGREAASRDMARSQAQDQMVRAAGMEYLRGVHSPYGTRTGSGETPEGTISRMQERGLVPNAGEDQAAMQQRRMALEAQQNAKMFYGTGAGSPDMRAQALYEAGGQGIAQPPPSSAQTPVGEPGTPFRAAEMILRQRGQPINLEAYGAPSGPSPYQQDLAKLPPELQAQANTPLVQQWLGEQAASRVGPLGFEQGGMAPQEAAARRTLMDWQAGAPGRDMLAPAPPQVAQAQQVVGAAKEAATAAPWTPDREKMLVEARARTQVQPAQPQQGFVGWQDPEAEMRRRMGETQIRTAQEHLPSALRTRPGTAEYAEAMKQAEARFGNLDDSFANTSYWTSVLTGGDVREAESAAADIARRITTDPDPEMARMAVTNGPWYKKVQTSLGVMRSRLENTPAGAGREQVKRYIAALQQIVSAIEGTQSVGA